MTDAYNLIRFTTQRKRELAKVLKVNSMIVGGKGLCSSCHQREGVLLDVAYPGYWECGYCRRSRYNTKSNEPNGYI